MCLFLEPKKPPLREEVHVDRRLVLSRLKFSLLLPGFYGALAGLAWLEFIHLPPDGLANLGLMLVVFPITLADVLVLRPLFASERSLLIPSQLGYYPAHAAYFVPSAAVIATCLYVMGAWIDRRRERARR